MSRDMKRGARFRSRSTSLAAEGVRGEVRYQTGPRRTLPR
jgi:hypothetical protein